MKSEKGFTLIELCISIALFLLIMTITFPSLWFLRSQQVISEVDKLFSVFGYLQQSAITSNKDQLLQFDLQNNSYSFESSTIKISEHIKFAIKENVKGPPSVPINNLTKPITFLKEQVVFYKDGKIQPGTVYLTDSKKEYLYAITVPISQVSLIRKYKYTGKWVLID